MDLNNQKYNVILDTDTYNECDDQFALAYLLKSPDVFNIEAITIAPFKNKRVVAKNGGIEESYLEAKKIFDLCGEDSNSKIYKGSSDYISNGYIYRNDAVSKIIEVALKNKKTYILGIAALTNIALAIKNEPRIIDKIEIIWLGGNTLLDFDNKNTNFKDLEAVRIVFNSQCKITIIPCLGVASNLKTSLYELDEHIKNKNKLCDFLYNRFSEVSEYYYNENYNRKTLWDISVVAYLINKNWFKVFSISCPYVDENNKYILSENRHMISFISSLDDNKIFNDLFNKLKG